MPDMYLNIGIQLVNSSNTIETDLPETSPTATMGYIVNACVGSLLTIVTFLLQLLVFAVVLRDARLRRPNNFFITSLASSDVLISVVLMPMWTVKTSLGYWPFGRVLCTIWNIADYVLCAISINTVCFIATDRYMSLQFPFKYPSRRSGSVAKRIYAAIWLVSFLVYSVLIGVTQYIYDHGYDPLQCETHYVKSVQMTMIITSTMLWIPIAYTLALYVLIYKIASQVAKSVKTSALSTISLDIRSETGFSLTSSPRNEDSTSNTLEGGNQQDQSVRTAKLRIMKAKQRVSDNMKALRTIGLLWLTFCFCWSPVGIALVYEALHPNSMNQWFLIAGYWLAYLNSFFNPFCYAIGNPQFRECLSKKILRTSKETVMNRFAERYHK